MKKVFLFFYLFFTFEVCSQNDYPLYSDVWRFEKKIDLNNNEYIMILPKKEDAFKFSLTASDYYDQNIDSTLVKSNLLSSYNKFRSDYGLKPSFENKELTRLSSLYAKKIKYDQIRRHSDLTKSPFYDYNHVLYEVINGINKQYFYNIDSTYGDFNKIVADCIFDSFVVSKTHTNILLNNSENYQVGFGVEFTNWGIVIVIQSVKTK